VSDGVPHRPSLGGRRGVEVSGHDESAQVGLLGAQVVEQGGQVGGDGDLLDSQDVNGRSRRR